MLSKQDRASLRSTLFRHLDGIVMAPTAYTLHKHGVTEFLLAEKRVSLSVLTDKFKANKGYLNVALRAFCSQGWLVQHADNQAGRIEFEINDSSSLAFGLFHLYEDVVDILKISGKYHARKFEMEPFLKMESTFKRYLDNYGLKSPSDEKMGQIQKQILAHIEGILVGPTIVRLGMSGMFHKYFMETRFRPEEFHANGEGFGRLLDLLTQLDWFNKINDSYEFTDMGLFFAKRASSYGVTVSYIPTLRQLDDLIFGDPEKHRRQKSGEEEQHVDREMNVWGSGGAHAAYFNVIDSIIIDVFNRPIDEQPKGILDMGCGNGAFLKHLFYVIENRTLRGTLLNDHPLSLIGVDYNETALKVSRKNLVEADIWAKVIWGDIGNPDLLAKDLKDKYNINLMELLNVRTFLDHNRMWNEPRTENKLRNSTSTGAFAYKGKWINNNLVSESLKQHFEKWTPFVGKFGLLVIELHTVKPELIAQNLGKTAVTAYDCTHGYSDQYIVELDEFKRVAGDAGLIPDEDKSRRFPDSELATVSINLFTSE